MREAGVKRRDREAREERWRKEEGDKGGSERQGV